MKGVNKLYLGWDAKFSAYSFPEHDIVVLLDGEFSTVLTEHLARNFRTKYTELSHHLCGISQTPWSRAILADRPSEDAYTVLFKEYFM